MTNTEHTPGPWQQDWHFIVAPDPDGIHPDIYIAEIADEDSDGRVASPEQREANGRLIVAAPAMLEALQMAKEALYAAPRFRVSATDSYRIAAIVDQAIATTKAAFDADASATVIPSVPPDTVLPTRFDAYEIGPCLRLREDGERDRFYYEPCNPENADVWTLYGHIPGQGVEAIGDFESCELAEQVYARITGKPYGQ